MYIGKNIQKSKYCKIKSQNTSSFLLECSFVLDWSENVLELSLAFGIILHCFGLEKKRCGHWKSSCDRIQ